MAVSVKVLIAPKQAEGAQTTQYTATGVTTSIDKFTASNTTGNAVTLAVNIVTSAGAAGVTNRIINKTLAAGEVYTFPEIVGQILGIGDFISTLASSAASITIRASGREFT